MPGIKQKKLGFYFAEFFFESENPAFHFLLGHAALLEFSASYVARRPANRQPLDYPERSLQGCAALRGGLPSLHFAFQAVNLLLREGLLRLTIGKVGLRFGEIQLASLAVLDVIFQR